MPAVSIIMPCYNVEKYIAAAIESALAQTYRDFELIIIDDGATDRSAAIYESYTDPRVRIIRQKNRGLAGARNTGIRSAKGRYIALLDSDDLWDATKLAKHVAHLENDPELGVSYSQSLLIDGEGRSIGIVQAPQLKGIHSGTVLCRNPIGNGSAPVFRADVFRDIAFTVDRDGSTEESFFDESFRYSEDIECWMRIACNTSWKMEGIGEPLTLYRVVPGGLSANTVKMYEHWNRMLAKVESYAPDVVRRHGPRARAYQLRYYARRAVFEGRGAEALRKLWQAVSQYPAVAIEEPRKTAETLAGGLLALLLPEGGMKQLEALTRR